MSEHDDIPPAPVLTGPGPAAPAAWAPPLGPPVTGGGGVVGADELDPLDDDTVEVWPDAEPPLARVPGTSVTCPGCGTVSVFDEIRRHASEFCRTCDYPLFWARGSSLAVGATSRSSESGLRRLPGTAGRIEIATLICWQCDEPNRVTALLCIRCGADLHPQAPEIPPAPALLPPPPPPPPPPRRVMWPWVLLAVVVVVAIVTGVWLLVD
ncbi:MAG: hypothetical protein ACRD0G_04770 [Acidimicrobiales bacterium]